MVFRASPKITLLLASLLCFQTVSAGHCQHSAFTYRFNELRNYQCCQPIRFNIPIYNEEGLQPRHRRLYMQAPGLYYFTFQTQVYNMDLYIKMVHNGHTYLEWFDRYIAPDEDNASGATLIPLQRGDTVHLEMHRGKNGMWGNAIFTGFALHVDGCDQ